jgi:mono/diheme cytochrome c family protein
MSNTGLSRIHTAHAVVRNSSSSLVSANGRALFVGLFLSFIALGFLGLRALDWRPAIAPIEPPSPTSFAPALVANGEALAGGGLCATCHTVKGGQNFAGGYPVRIPFGVIYSANITPDPETGIGHWSEVAFARAMRKGVSRDGSHLFPVFPYDHFTNLSDEDAQALYAYVMTRTPVRTPARKNELPFLLNSRL